ncbi:hypothetical protein GOP47_0021650 [Adiantum capillus-veneris]|uniref:Fibronectin type-III domain-containing protein n=1 Tax=Adiantum capillus-veneris TaxID=13818 RepID=A0A9D4U7W5_ADICA|nr:hypothetical protein GOP47_0021650 [Adiantum capillus-veneris]
MQDLHEGQHWSGQGILEGYTWRFGGSHESKPPEVAFTKLLANFEAQELPSSLHQSSTLIPFRRQRKSCRPLRIPPTCETALPLQDDNKGSLGEGDALIKQHSPPSLTTHKNGLSFGSGERRKLEPSSPTLKEAPPTEKFLLNGIMDDCPPLPRNLKFEGVITHQENGLNLLSCSTRCALTNGKHSNGAATCGATVVNSLPYFQVNGAALAVSVNFLTIRGILVFGYYTDGSIPSLDGSYYCQSCHSVMPLIWHWREQLRAAKGSLTLDNLHYRLYLSYRLLKGTKLFKDVHAPIEEAMKRVHAEVSQMELGSVMRLQSSMAVLSCKIDVHRLIDLALEKAGSWSLAGKEAPPKKAGQSTVPVVICFEDVSSSMIVVAVNVQGTCVKSKLLGYKLWHRKASEEPAYARTPTSILYNMDDKCVVSNLHPLTDYTFKIVPFSMEGDIAVCEAGCSTKGKEHKDHCEAFEGSVSVYSKRAASLQDERRRYYLGQRNVAGVQEERDLHSLDASLGPSKCKQVQLGMENSNMEMGSSGFDCCDGKQCYHTINLNRLCSSNGDLPSQNWVRQGDGRDNGAITTQAEMELDHMSEDNHKQGVFTCKSEADFHNYEFSVKVIRWLECKGHLKEEFRMKFLTWFTLSASEQEKRVISVFIDTLQDDPASLAGQLVDAFEEMIGVGRCPIGSDGFCRRLR